MQKGTDKDISRRFEEQEIKLKNTFKSIRKELEAQRKKIKELEKKLERKEKHEEKRKVKEFWQENSHS